MSNDLLTRRATFPFRGVDLPKNPSDNSALRACMEKATEGETPEARRAQDWFLGRCLADPFWYINAFVWQHNPLKRGVDNVGPFVCWDFQERAVRTILDKIETGGDLAIEKSREMGASWLCLILMDWLARFRKLQAFIFISHMESMVTSRHDPGSLFWKLHFIDQHLPKWLPHITSTKGAIHYPATNSYITGYATTTRAGVGARATAIFLDEFAKQPDAEEIWGQTADTSTSRIVNSTHYGVGTHFYRLCKQQGLDKMVMHWSEHPEKRPGLYTVENGIPKHLDQSFTFPPDYLYVLDGSPAGGPHPGLRSPWYDGECIRRVDARQIAMHLDINPSGADSQFFEPLRIKRLQQDYAREALWQGDVLCDKATGKFLGLKENPKGKLRLWRIPNYRGQMALGFYGMGCDISTGTGASNSCIAVGDAVAREKVGEYTDADASADDLAPVAVALGWLFKTSEGEGARMMWEKQGPGVRFGKKVIELGYRGVYYRSDELGGVKAYEQSEIPGWMATPDNKRVLLEEYKDALYKGEYCNPSQEALEECLAFRYTSTGQVEHAGQTSGNDPTGARVNHGDRVIADALCLHRCKSFGTIAVEAKREREPSILSLEGRRLYKERQHQEQIEEAYETGDQEFLDRVYG